MSLEKIGVSLRLLDREEYVHNFERKSSSNYKIDFSTVKFSFIIWALTVAKSLKTSVFTIDFPNFFFEKAEINKRSTIQ